MRYRIKMTCLFLGWCLVMGCSEAQQLDKVPRMVYAFAMAVLITVGVGLEYQDKVRAVKKHQNNQE